MGNRTRSTQGEGCTESIVPTTTGVGKKVLLHLENRIQGISLRLPTQDVSLINLTVNANKSSNLEQVKAVLKSASENSFSSYVGYSDEPLVSVDFMVV